MNPTSDSRHIPDAQDTNWRSVLLRRLTAIAIALVLLVAIAVLAGSHSGPMRLFSVSMLVYAVILGPLLLLARIPDKTKSVIIVASFALASTLAYVGMGFLAGPALTVAFSLVVAGLLLGRIAFISMLLSFSAFLVLLTVLVATGAWQGPTPMDTNPGNPNNWIRTGVVTIAIWTGLGFSILYVVNAIEDNLAGHRAALSRLRQEIADRRAAETARREAEAIAHQAQKMEAIGHLASGIAHDVNNALLVIKGWNEIRSQYDSQDTQREATQAIESAAEHTAQLSRQLLTFARKEVRKPKYVYLEKLVSETVRTLRHVVGSKIDLRFESEDEGLVYADEAQIQQLVFNLVINARDALQGTGEIRVSISRADDRLVESLQPAGNDWIALRVTDNGPGIDENVRQRIFEPFFTTKQPGEGSGLGLSTVLGIAQQSGGHVDLDSTPGNTVFTVLLPAADLDNIDAVPRPLDQSAGGALSNPQNLRILVVEDDELARRMIRSMLTRTGNEVRDVANGDDALRLLQIDPAPFDLLCSDAVFPGASLEAVLDAFEKHSPDGSVLVCSGYVPDEIAVSKLESGEYAFLAKPFTGSELLASIQDIVQARDTPG